MFEDTKYHGYSLNICPLNQSWTKNKQSILKEFGECFTDSKYLSLELLIRNQQVGANCWV